MYQSKVANKMNAFSKVSKLIDSPESNQSTNLFTRESPPQVDLNEQKILDKIFFMPVIFKPTDSGTTLNRNIIGANIIEKALVGPGSMSQLQTCKVLPRLLSHSEVINMNEDESGDLFDTSDISKTTHFHATEVQVEKEDLPMLNYLVVSMHANNVEDLEVNLDDWNRVKSIVSGILSFQDASDYSCDIPIVLHPMSYRDAIVEGTVSVIDMLKQVVSDDSECGAVRIDGEYMVRVNIELTQLNYPQIRMSNDEISADIVLDFERMGPDGIIKIVEHLYKDTQIMKSRGLVN
jgi:hypothetical protein